MRGVDRQVIDIPLAVGRQGKHDPRALEVGALAVCKNAEFEELGGLQERKPFIAISSDSGNDIADIRRLAVHGEELVAFTKDKLYSYSSADGIWTERADYLAPKLTERSRFVDNAEQYDCDRAELNGVAIFCWAQNVAGSVTRYTAGIDTVTGSVLLSPTAFGGTSSLPRLAVTTNRIALAYKVGTTTLRVRMYNPSDISTSATADHTATGTIASLDLVANGASLAVAVQLTTGTSYDVAIFSETPAVTASANKARTCDGPISIDYSTGASRYGIARVDGTDIVGDQLLAALTDTSEVGVALATASGSAVDQLTIAAKSVADGSDYRWYVLWSSDEDTGSTGFDLEYNWMDDDGTAGTAATLVKRLGLASHAFDHDGEIYVWTAFALVSNSAGLQSQIQNSYFLYRVSDGLLVAKAANNVAGGYAQTSGHLPSVQSTSGNVYVWCGVERALIPLGQDQKGYAARSPREIALEFDSNEARRTVQLGRTLYIAGGQISQYDGQQVAEVGFHVFPTEISVIASGAGNLNGTYFWKQTTAWVNAQGEIDEGSTATYYDQAMTNNESAFTVYPIHVTAKSDVALQFWRNVAAGGVGAPFYLVTSPDPSTTGDNKYIQNDPTVNFLGSTWNDNISDANLISRRIDPEGGVLPRLAPPAATIIAADQNRIFLAGISDNPHRVYYSRERFEGEVASFNDALHFDLPALGGDITALAFLSETLVVFKERAIYYVPGTGLDNGGGGANYGPARVISEDVGASAAETVALTPRGIIFKSAKGWYLLGGGLAVDYIGGPVSDYDSDSFVAVHVMDGQHQVRCTSTDRMLVWDYLVDQWGEWTISDALHSVVWDGVHHYAADDSSDDTVLAQDVDFEEVLIGDAYTFEVESPWIKIAGLQGAQSVRRVLVLGEIRGAGKLRIRIAYNYEQTDAAGVTWVDDKVWTLSPDVGVGNANVGGPMQVRHTPQRRKCQAIKINISNISSDEETPTSDETFALTGLALEVGVKRGPFRQLPAAQKQ